jgi:hypothetical protein
MSADEASPNEEQLARDAREFGSLVAKAAQDEIEGEASEMRLQDIRNVFLRAIDYIERQHGPKSATMWQDEANRAIQERFAALRPPQDDPLSTDAGMEGRA